MLRGDNSINSHRAKKLSKNIMKPLLGDYRRKSCSANPSDECLLITMYYGSESQAVIARQEFSLKGEMREIGAGPLWFPLSGLMSADRG